MVIEFTQDYDRFKKGGRVRILRSEGIKLLANGIAKRVDITKDGPVEDAEDVVPETTTETPPKSKRKRAKKTAPKKAKK